MQTVNANSNIDHHWLTSEGEWSISVWGAVKERPACLLLAGPHDPQSTAEKRRYPGGKLPMSVHGSKVAMPVNCDQPPLKLLTKVARDTNKGSQNWLTHFLSHKSIQASGIFTHSWVCRKERWTEWKAEMMMRWWDDDEMVRWRDDDEIVKWWEGEMERWWDGEMVRWRDDETVTLQKEIFSVTFPPEENNASYSVFTLIFPLRFINISGSVTILSSIFLHRPTWKLST